MHPLKIEFNKYIQENYDAYDGRENEERTEIVAQKVHNLGLSYGLFVEVACSLWYRWAKQKGWKYPYWSLVSSDKTFERIKDLIEYTDVGSDVNVSEFEYELAYILDYIDWWMGVGDRPSHEHDVSARVKIEACEYVCQLYGIPFISSDYNYIAQQVEELHGEDS